MNTSAGACKAVPANSEQSYCPYHASANSLFCRVHAEEHRALEEEERTAAREANRLKSIVEDMVAEGVDAYTQLREIRRAERVVGLYSESLRQQVDAAIALKTLFFSEAEDRGSEGLAVLEERTEIVVVFLSALQERADALEREPQRDQEEVISLPSESRESAPAPAAAVRSGDESPAYPILEVPHPPCACTAVSEDKGPHPRDDLPDSCAAVVAPRNSFRCAQTRLSGERFCSTHCDMHQIDIDFLNLECEDLEDLRTDVACRDSDKAHRIAAIRRYVDELDKMTTTVEEHQHLFSCKSSESHTALLNDLKMRRTSAVLLLGELNGRADAKIAESRGQAETWATEYLAEVKQKDAVESRKASEDLLTGAIITGVSMWFGVPWARSAIAGVVTSLVARTARDHSANKS